MDRLYSTITSNPILLFITVALFLLLVWAVLKKILKLILILLLLLTAYGAYLVHLGQPLPKTPGELVQQGKETMIRIREQGKGMVNTEHWQEVLDGQNEVIEIIPGKK